MGRQKLEVILENKVFQKMVCLSLPLISLIAKEFGINMEGVQKVQNQ